MACECTQAPVRTVLERATLRTTLLLNVTMFVVGMAAGLWAQSTGLMADALDMLADACALRARITDARTHCSILDLTSTVSTPRVSEWLSPPIFRGLSASERHFMQQAA